MTDDPMNMFVQDATKAYDFDKIDLQKKKKSSLRRFFWRMQNLLRLRQQFCLHIYQKRYIEQKHNIIFNLKGKLNYYQFGLYFASFFKESVHRRRT